MRFQSHEEFFDTMPTEVRERLKLIQQEVERCLPDATRCISYQMPAYRRNGVFFYFAGFKRHIGVYPPMNSDAALVAEATKYRGPKGNLLFPHDEPLPVELIGRIAVALAAK